MRFPSPRAGSGYGKRALSAVRSRRSCLQPQGVRVWDGGWLPGPEVLHAPLGFKNRFKFQVFFQSFFGCLFGLILELFWHPKGHQKSIKNHMKNIIHFEGIFEVEMMMKRHQKSCQKAIRRTGENFSFVEARAQFMTFLGALGGS